MKRWIFASGLLGIAAHPSWASPPPAAPHRAVQIQSAGVDLTAPRHLFSVTPLTSSEWLIAGGFLDKTPTGKVSDSAEVLDASNPTKPRIRPLNSHMALERWGHAATRLKSGNVFVCGGSARTECDRYEANKAQFAPAGKMTHARSASAQILLPSGKVLITGGYNRGDSSLGKVHSSVEIFDPETNQVTLRAPMSTARAGHELFLVEDKAYAVGGLNPESAAIEAFDESSQKFSTTGMKLPYSLKDFQSYQAGSIVYLVGGTKPDGNSVDKVFKIDFQRQSVEEMPGHLAEPREDLAICIHPRSRQAMVLGGEIKGNQRNGIHSDKAEIITFEPFSISSVPSQPFRDDSRVVPLSNGDCLILGGTNANEEMEMTTLRVTF